MTIMDHHHLSQIPSERGVNGDLTPSPTPLNEAPMREGQRRGPGFKEEEDRTLIASWLNVSKDAIDGSDQGFWKRIHENYYRRKSENLPYRKERALNMRWHDIQKDVNLFCLALEEVEAGQCSGMSDLDKMHKAKAIYKALSGKKEFNVMHCWEVLKDEPKWKQHRAEKDRVDRQNKRKSTVIEDDDTFTPERIGQDKVNEAQNVNKAFGNKDINQMHCWEVSEDEPDENERQKKRKGMGIECDDTALLEGIYISRKERNLIRKQTFKMMIEESKKKEESLHINKERLHLEKQRIELKKRKIELMERSEQRQEERAEEDIMRVDTTNMSYRLKTYWESKQDCIFKKYNIKERTDFEKLREIELRGKSEQRKERSEQRKERLARERAEEDIM